MLVIRKSNERSYSVDFESQDETRMITMRMAMARSFISSTFSKQSKARCIRWRAHDIDKGYQLVERQHLHQFPNTEFLPDRQTKLFDFRGRTVHHTGCSLHAESVGKGSQTKTLIMSQLRFAKHIDFLPVVKCVFLLKRRILNTEGQIIVGSYWAIINNGNVPVSLWRL